MAHSKVFSLILLFSSAVFLAIYTQNAHDIKLVNAPLDAELFETVEFSLTNSTFIRNRFDFTASELRAHFISPSGKIFQHHGFYTGHANNYKLRFFFDESGTWTYRLFWTDNQWISEGKVEVGHKQALPPLVLSKNNSFYFDLANGQKPALVGYSLHLYLEGKYGRGYWNQEAVKDLSEKMLGMNKEYGANLQMIAFPVFIERRNEHFWHEGLLGTDFSRFNPQTWELLEDVITLASRNGIYVLPFVTMVDQYSERPEKEHHMNLFIRYLTARFGAMTNLFGYSPTWEFHDIYTVEEANIIMMQLHENLAGLPIPPLLTIHDFSSGEFSEWLDFSMRQQPGKNWYAPASRAAGIQGGVGNPFRHLPIIASEDLWESCESFNNQPSTAQEIVRATWGILLNGVLPIYNESGFDRRTSPCSGIFDLAGSGKSGYFNSVTFFYQHIGQVEADGVSRNIQSNKPNRLVYEDNQRKVIYNFGNALIELAEADVGKVSEVIWFDPYSGQQIDQKGELKSVLIPPFKADDSVLLLKF